MYACPSQPRKIPNVPKITHSGVKGKENDLGYLTVVAMYNIYGEFHCKQKRKGCWKLFFWSNTVYVIRRTRETTHLQNYGLLLVE